MIQRPSLLKTYMVIAGVWSARSTCSSRVAVGAVIVNRSGQIIASGYNGSPHGEVHCDVAGCNLDGSGHCIRAIHAEENAIIQCAMTGVSTVGSSIYITHSPCQKCARRILQAGIQQVVFSTPYGSDAYEVLTYLMTRKVAVYKYNMEGDRYERP